MESISGGHGRALCLDSCRARGAGGAGGAALEAFAPPANVVAVPGLARRRCSIGNLVPAPMQWGVYGDVLSSTTHRVPWEESFLLFLQYLSTV